MHSVATIIVVISAQGIYYRVPERFLDQDKDIVLKLAHELIAEGKYKIHQIDGIRDDVFTQIGGQVGLVMGQIREKYRSMLEIYRQTNNKYNKKSKLVMPRLETRRPLHYVIRMEYVSELEVDIDRLIHVLETLPSYFFETSSSKEISKEELFKNKTLRMDSNQMFDNLFALQEQKLKSEYRQKYLMKKLGQSINQSTTSKRFLKQWPVDETWKLDKYNYLS